MSINLNCWNLVTDVRMNLDEAGVTSAKWSDTEIVKRINQVKDYYVNQINKYNPTLVFKNSTVTYVSGTELYDWPADLKAIKRMEIDGTKERVEPIDIGEKEIYRASNDFHDSRPAYYKAGSQFGLINVAGDVRLYFQKRVRDLHYGTVSAFTATTLTFDLTPNGSSSGDYTVRRNDDYYNGLIIDVYSGTGAGQERTITDYVGSTKVATVATWGTNPDTSSLYALKYDLPEEVDSLITLRAALKLIPKERNKSAVEITKQMQQEEREFLTNLSRSKERKYVEYVGD